MDHKSTPLYVTYSETLYLSVSLYSVLEELSILDLRKKNTVDFFGYFLDNVEQSKK